MWSFARLNLGMGLEEFWSLTQEEFDALVERWEEEQIRWDHRFGVSASFYANCKVKPEERVKPLALFGWIDPEDEDFEMTPEQTVKHLQAIASKKPQVGQWREHEK